MAQLGEYDSANAKAMYDKYPKFSIVRHPLERIVSAWYDKFGSNTSTKEKENYFVNFRNPCALMIQVTIFILENFWNLHYRAFSHTFGKKHNQYKHYFDGIFEIFGC